MKVIAAVEVDLDTPPLGTAVRATELLDGVPILRRTVQRVSQSRRIASMHVITSPAHHDAVAGILSGIDVKIETHSCGPPPWQDRVRRARKWATDGWRGGIGALCGFDESIHAGVLGALGRRQQAQAVASIPAAAVLLDPALLDAMIEHFATLGDDYRIVFCQAPPGLAAFAARPDFLDELYRAGQPPGAVLCYIPSNPQLDFTGKPCCYGLPTVVNETSARLLADTHRGVALLHELLSATPEKDLTAETICRKVAELRAGRLDRLPHEVEIELTTDDQLANTTIRPRGHRVPSRGPINMDTLRKIVRELSESDDSLLVLGGFGEPLLHPAVDRVLAICREAGIFGVAIRTNGLAMSGELIDAMIDHAIDVVNVTIDAHSAETYRSLNGDDGYEKILANIEALQVRIAERKTGGPLIVPEMAKVRTTLPEQEAFFDHWIARTGWANIVTPSHYAHALPDQSVMSMAPPNRSRCRRLWSRLMVLADGKAVTCDQDLEGRQVAGDTANQSLEDIWNGPALKAIREAHVRGQLDQLPVCPACDEWHRP